MHDCFKTIYSFIKKPWIISFFLLIIFLITTGYKFGWDDQHVEIPLLKSLIDPDLYPNDYYVQSLKVNFSSFFYPLLAKLISIKQIPYIYFFLFALSRYLLIYFTYKLWLHISKNKITALCCMLNFLLVIRVDEFLYRTFSHQEFALGLIAGGIYLFFKERFILASLLLGITANIHGLYSLFPMLFIGVYLLFNIKKHGWKVLFQSSISFLIACSPFIFWVLKNRLNPNMTENGPTLEWLSLFLIACPQNFALPFTDNPYAIFTSIGHFLDATQLYLAIILLFAINIIFNKNFIKNTKAITYSLTAFTLLIVALIFTNIFPNRFFIDLNIIRNTQYLLYLLPGYTVILIIQNSEKRGAFFAFASAILLFFIKFSTMLLLFGTSTLLLLLVFLSWIKMKNTYISIPIKVISFSALICSTMLFIYRIQKIQLKPLTNTHVFVGIIACILAYIFIFLKKNTNPKLTQKITKYFILIPLIVFTYHHTIFHIIRYNEETKGKDFWELQRNWVDMQNFVRDNTNKNSTLMVPHDMLMGGFRIHSERTIIASYRDCGIVGFDYAAAKEWQKRIEDIKAFSVVPKKETYRHSITMALKKYKVDYIVFMNFISPQKSNTIFERVYQNKFFTLVKIKILRKK